MKFIILLLLLGLTRSYGENTFPLDELAQDELDCEKFTLFDEVGAKPLIFLLGDDSEKGNNGINVLASLEKEIHEIKKIEEFLKVTSLSEALIFQPGSNDLYTLSGRCFFYDKKEKKIYFYNIIITYLVIDSKRVTENLDTNKIESQSVRLKKRNVEELIFYLPP